MPIPFLSVIFDPGRKKSYFLSARHAYIFMGEQAASSNMSKRIWLRITLQVRSRKECFVILRAQFNTLRFLQIQYTIRLMQKYPADTPATELQEYE